MLSRGISDTGFDLSHLGPGQYDNLSDSERRALMLDFLRVEIERGFDGDLLQLGPPFDPFANDPEQAGKAVQHSFFGQHKEQKGTDSFSIGMLRDDGHVLWEAELKLDSSGLNPVAVWETLEVMAQFPGRTRDSIVRLWNAVDGKLDSEQQLEFDQTLQSVALDDLRKSDIDSLAHLVERLEKKKISINWDAVVSAIVNQRTSLSPNMARRLERAHMQNELDSVYVVDTPRKGLYLTPSYADALKYFDGDNLIKNAMRKVDHWRGKAQQKEERAGRFVDATNGFARMGMEPLREAIQDFNTALESQGMQEQELMRPCLHCNYEFGEIEVKPRLTLLVEFGRLLSESTEELAATAYEPNCFSKRFSIGADALARAVHSMKDLDRLVSELPEQAVESGVGKAFSNLKLVWKETIDQFYGDKISGLS